MDKKVEIYTSNTCSYCHAAKNYFNENNISFVEHNISEDTVAKRNLMKLGYMSVPIILIDGKEVLGFDKDKVNELLEQ